jgi:hypothetical protein
MKTKLTKTLYVGNAPDVEGEIFWDDDKNIITGIHDNDANFRDEYFEPLFNHFGIKIKRVKKLPNWITNEILAGYGLADENESEE